MNISEEEKGIVWLCGCGRFDYRQQAELLRAAKNPARLLTHWEEIVKSAINSDRGGVYNIDREMRERELHDLLSYLERRDYFPLTILSDDYPESLKVLSDPPFLLYGAGNRELLGRRKLAIVGSRITPLWAEKEGQIFSSVLSRRFCIVTGFAEGGDKAAILGALESGNLICVLANGLDECYPAAHADLKEKVKAKGLLLSEYPPKEKTRKFYFLARNRILAGLSEGVLVLSAKEGRSGALVTANDALEYGREVFAFPYNIGISQGSGCNELIKKGAMLVTSPADILSYFGMEEVKREKEQLSKEEKAILKALKEHGEMHVTLIAEKTGMAVFELLPHLSSLEMKNLAATVGGNRYAAL